MTKRLINLGIIVAFSICYMEWGTDGSSFMLQTEYIILSKTADFWSSITHPLILSGLAGQILLLIAAFQKSPNRLLTYTGTALLGIIVLFVLLAGALSVNIKQILSTLPFLALAVMAFQLNRKQA